MPAPWAVRESFHLHDLRSPWLGQPWIGWANYAEAAADGLAEAQVIQAKAEARKIGAEAQKKLSGFLWLLQMNENLPRERSEWPGYEQCLPYPAPATLTNIHFGNNERRFFRSNL